MKFENGSKLEIKHIENSYYEICGKSIIDLSTVFEVTKAEYNDCSFSARFSIKTKFGAESSFSFNIGDDIFKEMNEKGLDCTDDKVLSLYVLGFINDFLENELLALISNHTSKKA